MNDEIKKALTGLAMRLQKSGKELDAIEKQCSDLDTLENRLKTLSNLHVAYAVHQLTEVIMCLGYFALEKEHCECTKTMFKYYAQ